MASHHDQHHFGVTGAVPAALSNDSEKPVVSLPGAAPVPPQDPPVTEDDGFGKLQDEEHTGDQMKTGDDKPAEDKAKEDEEMVDAEPVEPNLPRKRKAVTVDARPDSDKDEEMEDDEPRRTKERVYFERATAPPHIKEEMLQLDVSQYPDALEIGDMGPEGNETLVQVLTKDIFELRGSDINTRFLPEGLTGGRKVRTIVDFAGLEFAGRHLEMSLDEAMRRDAPAPAPAPANQQGKGKGKGKGKQAAPAPPVKPKDPPADEVVKAKFHLDTQSPHIEISTIDPDTNNILSTRIWAHEFAFGDQWPWIGFRIGRMEHQDDLGACGPSMDVMNKMAGLTNTTVVRAGIFLWRSRVRVWDGISESSLAAIRAKPDLNKVRDMLIVGLDKSTVLGLSFSTKASPGNLTKWTQKLDGYFRDLLMIAKHYGNFWFYRRQCELDEKLHSPSAIERAELPKTRFVTPRWLVTEWSAMKITEPAGNIHYTNLAPHKWSSLEFPDSYENVDEAAFMLKLSAKEEMLTQRRHLSELVRSDGLSHFRGRFHSLGESRYSVEVYLGLEAHMAEAKIKIPAAGTRIELSVDRTNSSLAGKSSLAKMAGHVVEDALQTHATFVCVVDFQGSLSCANTGSEYAILIDYIVDDLPFERQIRAISELQMAKKIEHGPDVHKIIFSCRKPVDGGDALKQKTTPGEFLSFRTTLHTEFTRPPNQMQELAAMHTTTSESGITVIVGPPGTGKTETVKKIAFAHARLGRRVMQTAPTNSAVHNLVDVFISHNDRLPAGSRALDHQWVYFTGAHSSTTAASKLKVRQSSSEVNLLEQNNAYLAHLRDSNLRDKAPRYEQTFGYKLLQRMEYWSTIDPATVVGDDNVHAWSRDYFKTRDDLPFLMRSEDATRARKHLQALESHLAIAFFKDVVFCFCTLSTSAHELVLDSGHWDTVIIDEAARETRAGIATVLGALHGRVSHITWSGDHNQGDGIIVGKDSNVGYKYLARNVFAEIADVSVKKMEQSIPVDVFTLDVCYRMPQRLMDWSSKYCYGGLVKSDAVVVGRHNVPLRNTLKAFWSVRVRSDFKGSYQEIGIDANHKATRQAGGTTWINKGEAAEVAQLIVDMLLFIPPTGNADNVQYCRIRGEHFIVISNYIGQVAEIRRALREQANLNSSIKDEDIAEINARMGTTSAQQGKEGDITIYSPCIATGDVRLPKKDILGLGFVASVKNFNVSMTRQRVARYIVGSFKLYVQATKDKHAIIHRHGEFFAHIRYLFESDFILSSEEMAIWREKGVAPQPADTFRLKLLDPATFSDQAMDQPEHSRPSGLYNIGAHASTAGINKQLLKQAPPKDTTFSGDRDKKGALIPGAPAQAAKKKKSGSKGAAHQAKRHNNGGGGPSGGAAGAAAST